MLTLTVEQSEFYNEATEKFIYLEGFSIELEHSLVSLSKWESKHQKPFLSSNEQTTDELKDYVRFMIISPDPPADVYERLTNEHLVAINDYIASPESATTFGEVKDNKPKGRPEVITAELIYYWMISFTVPIECETWHLNRLFALLRIYTIKNSKPTKMSKKELADRNRSLNQIRREQLGTKG